jgi:hypothetical protein
MCKAATLDKKLVMEMILTGGTGNQIGKRDPI